MKFPMFATLFALVVAGGPACAQVPSQAEATPAVAATADRGEQDGFTGHLLITPEADWRERWNTPGRSRPEFSTADAVAVGGELHILVFLANPAPGLGGRADVRCDIRVIRPDGTYSVSERNVACYEGVIATDARETYLAAPTMMFRAEATDQRGRWRVQVTLRDRARGAEVRLESGFTVTD